MNRLRDAVWRALDTVFDPELDEPITDLDFVESCTVSEDGTGVATGARSVRAAQRARKRACGQAAVRR